MTDKTNEPDKGDLPEDEKDVEGHSMLVYEQARMVVHERQREAQKHAHEARMLEERRRQKR